MLTYQLNFDPSLENSDDFKRISRRGFMRPPLQQALDFIDGFRGIGGYRQRRRAG